MQTTEIPELTNVPDAEARDPYVVSPGEASALLAGHPRLTAASLGLGPKPVPGDGEPVLGPLRDVNGLFVAFSHSGATLGLIAGELLAEQMLTGAQPPLLAPFTAARFA